MDKLLYTPTEAAQAVGGSRPTLYRWMHMANFPVMKIGGCTRIPVRAFEQWLYHRAGIDIDSNMA